MDTVDQIRARLSRASTSERNDTRAMATDALATPELTDASRTYFTRTLEALDSLTLPATTPDPLPSTDQAARRKSGGAPTSNQYGTFTVRYATDKQAAYLRHLFASRDASVKVGITAAMLNRAARELESGSIALRLAHDAINALLTCPPADHPAATTEQNRLTERQEATIRKTAPRKIGGPAAVQAALTLTGAADVSDLSKSDASKLIDILVKAQWMPRDTAPAPAVTEGMYSLPGTPRRVVKVQKSRESGRLYAKELIDGTFTYAPGLLRLVHPDHRMTLEEAQAYGKLYGTCCVCGRTLTDENSIAAGIGPVCASKTAWA